MISIFPYSIPELRTLNDDLCRGIARTLANLLGRYMDASTQTEDQGCIGTIENEIATSQQDLSRRRYGCRHF
jgi:hypothetical protein